MNLSLPAIVMREYIIPILTTKVTMFFLLVKVFLFAKKEKP